MQQVQRAMLPSHIQTPTLQHPHTLSHEDTSMTAVPRMMFPAQQGDAATLYEQQTRLIQQREGKAAQQRALGVSANGPSVQQHPGVQVQHIRQAVLPTGQTIFIDAQGRQLQPPAGFTFQVPQRPAPGAQQQAGFIQVQAPQFQQNPYQAQISQAQYQQQLAIQQAQLAARNQAQSQPPSARPPHAASPALLHVPGPLKRAVSHVVQRRSASPLPLHMRTALSEGATQNPPGSDQQGQAVPPPRTMTASTVEKLAPPHALDTVTSLSATAGTNETPAGVEIKEKLGEKSDVAKARRREGAVKRMKKHVDMAQRQYDAALKEAERFKTNAEETLKKWKKDSDTERKRFDDLVLEYLEKAGYTEASKSLKTDRTLKSTQSEMKKPEPEGDASEGDSSACDVSMEVTIDDKTSKPATATTSPTKSQCPATAGSLTSSKGAASESDEDDEFLYGSNKSEDESMESSKATMGDSSFESSSTESSDVPMAEEGEGKAAGEEKEEPQELGYLYTWWNTFEDVQRLSKRGLFNPNKLIKASPPPADQASTAEEPTAPALVAVAIEASVAQHHQSTSATPAPRANSTTGVLTPIESTPSRAVPPGPGTAVTATLRQAEEMRKMQEAHIKAQQTGSTGTPFVSDDEVRRMQLQAVAMSRNPSEEDIFPTAKGVVQLPDGRKVMMTREEFDNYNAHTQQVLQQSLIQDAQRRGMATNGHGVLQHPQPMMANGTIHQQMNGHVVHPIQYTMGIVDGAVENRMKRSGDSTPVEGPSKRAKVEGTRPTPEQHQRQALEAAARAQGMPAPGIAMPLQMGQAMARAQSTSQQGRPRSEEERLYAQQLAEYARQQVANSPAVMAPSPNHLAEGSPLRIFDPTSAATPAVSGPTPPTTARGRAKKPPSLSFDLDSSVIGEAPPTTASAKRKGGGGKWGGKAGGGRGGKKGGKNRPSIDASTDGEGGAFSFLDASAGNPEDGTFQGTSSAPSSSQSQLFALPSGYPGDAQQWPQSSQDQATSHANGHDSGGAISSLTEGAQPVSGGNVMPQFEHGFDSGEQLQMDEFLKTLGNFADEGMSFAQAAGEGAPTSTIADGPPISASGEMSFDIGDGSFGDFDFGNFNSSTDDSWV